ncbi:MAG: helix-turn-helix domain-containing protein [Bdellovibrionota bacterium]
MNPLSLDSEAARMALVADGLASVREAAAFLKVSRSTLYKLMDAGGLASVKIRGNRRVPWRVLRQFAAANFLTAPSGPASGGPAV